MNVITEREIHSRPEWTISELSDFILIHSDAIRKYANRNSLQILRQHGDKQTFSKETAWTITKHFMAGESLTPSMFSDVGAQRAHVRITAFARITSTELQRRIGCSATHVRNTLTKDASLNPRQEPCAKSPVGYKWMFDDNPTEIARIKAEFVARYPRTTEIVTAVATSVESDALLAKIRTQDLWTYEQAAKLLNVHPSTISKGFTQLDLKTLTNGKYRLLPSHALVTYYEQTMRHKATHTASSEHEAPSTIEKQLKRIEVTVNLISAQVSLMQADIAAMKKSWE